MDIRQVRYFLIIVETGSFSAAADDLFTSQSSISKQIIALEKELDVQFFDRSKRKITLTDAGEAFLPHAQKLYLEYKAMLADLDSHKSQTDTFSIAAFPVIAQYGITNCLAQFKNSYPAIRFTLEELEGLNILPALDEKRFDLAFTRDNFINKNKYTTIEICKDKLLVVVSKRNRHSTKSSVSLFDLSKDNFIAFDKVTILNKLIMEECNRVGFEPIVFYSSLRIESIFGLVASNIGIALMPEKIYDYYQHPEVVSIPLEKMIESNIVLVHLKNKKLPKAAQVFIKFLKNSLLENKC